MSLCERQQEVIGATDGQEGAFSGKRHPPSHGTDPTPCRARKPEGGALPLRAAVLRTRSDDRKILQPKSRSELPESEMKWGVRACFLAGAQTSGQSP